MKAFMVRLPADLERGVRWVTRRERLTKPVEGLRRLLWLGLEREVARRYEAGELSLRDAADLLGLSAREALEAIGQAGVRGGFHLDTDLRLLDAARSEGRGRSRPARS